MIKLVGINKVYRVGEEDFFALKNISLKINKGELVGLIGASGSGKSTLMHLIGLLDRPTSGQILIADRDVAGLDDDALSRLRNEFVGFVFQQFNLINKLSVRENILLPSVYRRGIAGQEYEKRADDLLKRFGMWERRDFYPNKISGGQQQRTAITRALIMNPKLILADEPTGNLDSKTGEEILKLLKSLNKDFGVTVVIVTHDENVARQTTRLIRLVDGEIKT
ncbi:MAG: ABC transporter ATP-binding protein [Candidatus Shapirobacteria bacterium]